MPEVLSAPGRGLDVTSGGWCEVHGGYTGMWCGGYQYDGVVCGSGIVSTDPIPPEDLARATEFVCEQDWTTHPRPERDGDA